MADVLLGYANTRIPVMISDRSFMTDAHETKAEPAILLDDVTLSYRKQTVLRHVNGQIDMGSLTAIVGPNGCGKSTLLKAISGMLSPAVGRIRISDSLRTHIAYLSQISEIDRSFPVTVFDFIACGLWACTGAFKAIGSALATRIDMALETVGMRSHAGELIGELSGGQFQRIRFAQLILQEAQLLMLDEPFTGIDEPTINDLMRLLQHWHQQGMTMLVVLHDTELVRAQFPQVMILGQNKQVVAWGETRSCLQNLIPAGKNQMPNTSPERASGVAL